MPQWSGLGFRKINHLEVARRLHITRDEIRRASCPADIPLSRLPRDIVALAATLPGVAVFLYTREITARMSVPPGRAARGSIPKRPRNDGSTPPGYGCPLACAQLREDLHESDTALRALSRADARRSSAAEEHSLSKDETESAGCRFGRLLPARRARSMDTDLATQQMPGSRRALRDLASRPASRATSRLDHERLAGPERHRIRADLP